MAKLQRADLQGADLQGADLKAAYLQEVRNWRDIANIDLANIAGVRDPPDDFRHWALCHGAVELGDWDEWQRIIRGEQPPPQKPPDCPKKAS